MIIVVRREGSVTGFRVAGSCVGGWGWEYPLAVITFGGE